MPKSSILVNPLRDSLYDAAELYNHYESDDYHSYQQMFDFQVYRDFVMNGKVERASGVRSVVQSLHDGSVMQTTKQFIEGKKLIGFMGGHKLRRTDDLYREVAVMAKKLSEKGFLIVSGGGPGAMEAAHLGAMLAGHGDNEVPKAIEKFQSEPSLPELLTDVVGESGKVDEDLLQKVHRWIQPALTLV